MGRKKEQTARRQELREAAGRAIAARGVPHLRITDVAAEAGISEGLVRYYYPDLDDLLLDLHQHSVDRFYWARLQAVADKPAIPPETSASPQHNQAPRKETP